MARVPLGPRIRGGVWRHLGARSSGFVADMAGEELRGQWVGCGWDRSGDSEVAYSGGRNAEARN